MEKGTLRGGGRSRRVADNQLRDQGQHFRRMSARIGIGAGIGAGGVDLSASRGVSRRRSSAKLAAKIPVEIWFQDERRLGQKNSCTRRWARRGTRPRALTDLRTKSAYLFGAIRPERGTGAAVVMLRADTQAMQHWPGASVGRPKAAYE
jgi:hypothetical protein